MASSSSSSVATSPLLYSCIAYKSTILAEHASSAVSGTSGLAAVVLPKIPHDKPQKLTYTHDQNFIHYIADAAPSSSKADSLSADGLTYLVVAKADLGRRVPFGFLVEIKKRFLKEFDPERTSFSGLPAYGAAAFNAQLRQLMVDYGTTKAGQEDAFANVQSEIDNVRGIMTENIERVLERGERIDLLVDKTDKLGGSARDFRVRSRGLRRKMWWKNVRLMVLLVVVIIFLVYLLVGFGCGLPGMFSNTQTDDLKLTPTQHGATAPEVTEKGHCFIITAFERFFGVQKCTIITSAHSRTIPPPQRLLQPLLRRHPPRPIQQPPLLHLPHHLPEILIPLLRLLLKRRPILLQPRHVPPCRRQREPCLQPPDNPPENNHRPQRRVLVRLTPSHFGEAFANDVVPGGADLRTEIVPVFLGAAGAGAHVTADVVAAAPFAAHVGNVLGDVDEGYVDEEAGGGEFLRVDARDGLGEVVLLGRCESGHVINCIERHNGLLRVVYGSGSVWRVGSNAWSEISTLHVHDASGLSIRHCMPRAALVAVASFPGPQVEPAEDFTDH